MKDATQLRKVIVEKERVISRYWDEISNLKMGKIKLTQRIQKLERGYLQLESRIKDGGSARELVSQTIKNLGIKRREVKNG